MTLVTCPIDVSDESHTLMVILRLSDEFFYLWESGLVEGHK